MRKNFDIDIGGKVPLPEARSARYDAEMHSYNNNLDGRPRPRFTPSLLGDLLLFAARHPVAGHCGQIAGFAGGAGRRTAGPARAGRRTRSVAPFRRERGFRPRAGRLPGRPPRRRPGRPGPACEPRRGRGRGHRRLRRPGRHRDAAEGHIDQRAALPGAAPAAHGRHRHSGSRPAAAAVEAELLRRGYQRHRPAAARRRASRHTAVPPAADASGPRSTRRSSPSKRASAARCSTRSGCASSRSRRRFAGRIVFRVHPRAAACVSGDGLAARPVGQRDPSDPCRPALRRGLPAEGGGAPRSTGMRLRAASTTTRPRSRST